MPRIPTQPSAPPPPPLWVENERAKPRAGAALAADGRRADGSAHREGPRLTRDLLRLFDSHLGGGALSPTGSDSSSSGATYAAPHGAAARDRGHWEADSLTFADPHLYIGHDGRQLVGVDPNGTLFRGRGAQGGLARRGTLADFAAQHATTCLSVSGWLTAVGYRRGTRDTGGLRLIDARDVAARRPTSDTIPSLTLSAKNKGAVVAVAQAGYLLTLLAGSDVEVHTLSLPLTGRGGGTRLLSRIAVDPWAWAGALGGRDRRLWRALSLCPRGMLVAAPQAAAGRSLRGLQHRGAGAHHSRDIALPSGRAVAVAGTLGAGFVATDGGRIFGVRADRTEPETDFGAEDIGEVTCLVAGEGLVVAGGTTGARVWRASRPHEETWRLPLDACVAQVAIAPGPQVITLGTPLDDAEARERRVCRFVLSGTR